MSIEFPCPKCGKTLRVDDAHAGQNARCPACSTISLVPNPAPNQAAENDNPFRESNAGPVATAPPNPFDYNPYASPRPVESAAPQDFSGVAPVAPTVVTVTQVFEYALSAWKENLGILVGMTVIAAIPNGMSNISNELLPMIPQNQNNEPFLIGLMIAFPLVLGLISFWLSIGEMLILLKIARGGKAEIGDLFRGGEYMWPYFLATLLGVVCVLPAFMLLIVPGIFLIIIFWPYGYFIVERRARVFESFSLAKSITSGNKGTIFLLGLVCVGLNLLGCAACFVGGFFTQPLMMMLFAVSYLMMSGQIPPDALYGMQRLKTTNQPPPAPLTSEQIPPT